MTNRRIRLIVSNETPEESAARRRESEEVELEERECEREITAAVQPYLDAIEQRGEVDLPNMPMPGATLHERMVEFMRRMRAADSAGGE